MGPEDRGIVDQAALRMREETIAAGVWLTYAVCIPTFAYIGLTWSHPNRAVLLGLFGSAVVAGGGVSLLPRSRIVRSRWREPFFLAWSLLDLLLIVLSALADGGTGSPLALIFFLPTVFASMSYPMASVMTVGIATFAGYVALALGDGGTSVAYEEVFAWMLTCTGVICSWMARNHERQRRMLMDVSRADPLTGCLNRRGFEERAIAEIGAAARRAGEGAVLLLDLDNFKEVNDRHGHATGDELLRWVVHTLRANVRVPDAIGRLGGDEFAVLFADITPTDALARCERISEALAERAPCSTGLASFPGDGHLLEDLMRRADARLYASRHGRPASGRASADERLSWAATLAHAVDLRMNAAHEHSRAVADRAVAIARVLGWDEEMLGMLRIAAILHDVGKVTVPDSILCKPDRLTPEEYEAIKNHSDAGAELVSRIDGLETIVPWIRHAHESFDGSGYPDGLSGEDIPQASRIMLVADAFDAITSTRPYRTALTDDYALGELARHAGSQFDPACVAALVEALELSVPTPRAKARGRDRGAAGAPTA